MENELKKRYENFEDEKLLSILIAKKNEYKEEAIKIAEQILIERGLKINRKEMFVEKFNKYYDDDLISILETNQEEYQDLAIEVVTEILNQRGFDIEEEEEIAKASPNYKPLVFGILLIAFNFIISGIIYEYNLTGRGQAFINLLPGNFIAFDIFLRVIVVGIILHYTKKQGSNYKILWVIGGVIFGAWALIPLGIMELLTDYHLDESELKE